MANVLETSMNYLQTQDPEVAACIENEFQRQKQNIELIASENIASPAVIAAMGSVLTNKYAEGYPGKRYYGGCDYVDVLETIAIERAKSCSARPMPMCSHTPARRQIWRSTPRFCSRAIRSWAWILPAVAI